MMKWLTNCTSITLKLLCTHCMLKFLHSNTLNTIRKVANGLNEPSARFSAPLGFVIAVLEACELIEGNFHGSCSQVSNEWLNFISITSFGRNNCKIQRVLLPHSELYDAMSSPSLVISNTIHNRNITQLISLPLYLHGFQLPATLISS